MSMMISDCDIRTSCHTTPPTSLQRKTPGPVFGTSLGRGLSLGGTLCSRAHPPLLSCPDALEVRQLLRYRPVSLRLRRALEARLRVWRGEGDRGVVVVLFDAGTVRSWRC